MATHVVITDTTLRRAKINVTPNTFLSEVFEQACNKLGVKESVISNYGLKHNNKPLDLSRTHRQSGLVSGAKLELVVVSKSPSVVTIALQLPEFDSKAIPQGRLEDKFPSNTTLWLMLRSFESGGGRNLNFTGRGVTHMDGAKTKGAGRIFYEMPVLNLSGRELSTLEELQKTIAQLGFNSGRCLVRLSFKKTTIPLEDAMAQIGRYFQITEKAGEGKTVEDQAVSVGGAIDKENTGNITSEKENPATPSSSTSSQPAQSQSLQSGSSSKTTPIPSEKLVSPDQRSIAVFSAPTTSKLAAASQPFNESDYEPSIVHAKLHQSRLQASTINQRLPSDAEAAAAASERAAKVAKVTSVRVRIRFPDQSIVQSDFAAPDTGKSLYDFVSGVIVAQGEPFTLKFTGKKGAENVPQSDKTLLIKDLGFGGAMLVNFLWQEKASTRARTTMPVLKPQYSAKATELMVQGLPLVDAAEDETGDSSGKGKAKEKGSSSGGLKKGLLGKKWLPKFGK